MQPPFGKFLPVALMVALFASTTVYIGNMIATWPGYAWAGAAWVPFISWALYFSAGAKISRLHKYVIGMIGGVLFGWLTIILGNMLAPSLAAFAFPVVIFFIVTTIVMLELTDWFELAPAYFFGFAGFFAYVFGGYPFAADHGKAVLVYSILTVTGLLLGLITSTLREKILDMLGVPLDQRATVFDREKSR